MLFSRVLLPQQVILIGSIVLAIALGIAYLCWRGRLIALRPVRIPLLLFALFGTCDALMTLSGTWQAPWREANPSMRAFLQWGGWWGQCLGSMLWILAWTLVFDGLESLRRHLHSRWMAVVDCIRLWTVYALAVGHLDGFVSWSNWPGTVAMLFRTFHHAWSVNAGWLTTLSPFGGPLYSGLCFGGLCTLVHWITISICKRGATRSE